MKFDFAPDDQPLREGSGKFQCHRGTRRMSWEIPSESESLRSTGVTHCLRDTGPRPTDLDTGLGSAI